MLDLIPFALAVALFLAGALRPWHALVILLAGLPLNGFLVHVLGDLFGFSGLSSIAWAAWHDALAGGVIAAAAWSFVRPRLTASHRLGVVEVLALAVLAFGIPYVVVAPYRLTALYAYRTLYEPIALAVAIVILARTNGIPEWAPRRGAEAMVVGGLVAAIAVWPQVYLGGFEYLDRFYHEAGERLSPSYVATAINQPRGVGTFNSPNELAAYLALVVGLLLTPGIVRLRPALRTTLLMAIGLGLLLSFSRSGWLSCVVIIVALILMGPGRAAFRSLRFTISSWQLLRPHLAPLSIALLLLLFVATSSGVGGFVGSTVSGDDPSAASRPASASEGISALRASPFGVGLGMAGPKSVRFGEVGRVPILASETWYITYAMQVGVAGLGLLVAFILAIVRVLLRGRSSPWPAAAVAIGAGLAAGAVFIPIIDDPAVAIPLWSILGYAIAVEAANRTDHRPPASTAAPSPASEDRNRRR